MRKLPALLPWMYVESDDRVCTIQNIITHVCASYDESIEPG